MPEIPLRYANWLFARALKLRESGDSVGAEQLELRAMACLDDADRRMQQQQAGVR